jgi:hypothetical protein
MTQEKRREKTTPRLSAEGWCGGRESNQRKQLHLWPPSENAPKEPRGPRPFAPAADDGVDTPDARKTTQVPHDDGVGASLGAIKFWALVDMSGGPQACWPWLGNVAGKGYGYFTRTQFKDRRAHRIAYTLTRGPIPDGLHIDHLCRMRLCCNPAHLQAVTNRENVLRGQHPNAVAHRTNICRRGHDLANARMTKKGRDCRECKNMRARVRKKARAGGS